MQALSGSSVHFLRKETLFCGGIAGRAIHINFSKLARCQLIRVPTMIERDPHAIENMRLTSVELSGYIARLAGARSGQWCHHDPVGKIKSPQAAMLKQ